MHPLSTASATSFLFTLLLFFNLAASFPSNDASNLPNCNQTFSCGAVTNITYPFTSGQRPSYCDPPEFHLGCSKYLTTTLTANSLPYLVTQVNQTSQTLRFSLLGLYNEMPCIDPFNMTTFHSSSFSLVSNHETLSLFYGCKNLDDADMANFFKFSCPGPAGSEEGFFKIGPGPGPGPGTQCQTSFQVPFVRSREPELQAKGSSLLDEVLKEGFDVSYSNPYSFDCKKSYNHSGGQCEFDGVPICIYDDQLCPGTGSSRFARGRKIAIAISGVVGAIIAFSIIAMTFRLKNSQNGDRFETFMMDYHGLTPRRYSYSEIKKITNSFTNKLGQGGFGNVYKGKFKDGRLVAVKVLKESEGDGEEFMNEVASITRTSHVNIVTLLGFCYERTKRALIYEFMTEGSLDKFISCDGTPKTKYGLEWKRFYEIAVGIARGLEYLHRGCNNRIVHFDIKPHNILLDEDFCPKISDFGLAKLCKSKVRFQ